MLELLIAAALYRLMAEETDLRDMLFIFLGVLMAFGLNAFFSRPDQFFIRGATDTVYLVENIFLSWPRMYILNDVTFNVLGGVWHEIDHVSVSMLRHLHFLFGRGKLDMRKAELRKIQNGESVFAVLAGTRYGIPDPATLNAIWPNGEYEEMSLRQLDKLRPGRDLVSIHYWPIRFQKTKPVKT